MTIQQKVEHVLKNYPRTRDNDNRLVATYWYVWHKDLCHSKGGKVGILFENLLKVPSFESVRRCRQKIQESGKYTASPKAQAVRDAREMKIALENAKKNPEIAWDVK